MGSLPVVAFPYDMFLHFDASKYIHHSSSDFSSF